MEIINVIFNLREFPLVLSEDETQIYLMDGIVNFKDFRDDEHKM